MSEEQSRDKVLDLLEAKVKLSEENLLLFNQIKDQITTSVSEIERKLDKRDKRSRWYSRLTSLFIAISTLVIVYLITNRPAEVRKNIAEMQQAKKDLDNRIKLNDQKEHTLRRLLDSMGRRVAEEREARSDNQRLLQLLNK